MYVAVLATVVGQALLLLQPGLLVYAAVLGAAMAAFVYGYEEPTLGERFGAEYDAYRRAVPAWVPRLRAWHPDQVDDGPSLVRASPRAGAPPDPRSAP
jgi:protein-S-isoprenylcysteine O-methyltransferase Ste14